MPIDKEELGKRKWPLPSFPIGQEVVGRKKEKGTIFYDDTGNEVIAKKERKYANLPSPDDYLESCYVREGKVKAIPLPIPPGECGITSLVKDKKGKIFGATSGEKCRLFVYEKEADKIIDLGRVEGNTQKSSLVVSSDGRLFLGTKPESEEGYIYSYNPKSAPPRIEKICCPVKNEGISALAIDNSLSRIYGLSSRSGIFFIFDIEKGKIELKGKVERDNLFSEALVVASNGDVFGGCRWLQLFKYDVKKECVIPLNVKVPSICGREMYNRIESLIWDDTTQSIYGGTTADGILFRFYPKEEKVISLGKPLNQPHIRCLTMGKDSCVYGIAGKSCSHLFKYNPEEGDLQDLGILYVSSPRYWHGYEFDSAVTGENGEIYLGENDRISHLFIYFPSGK